MLENKFQSYTLQKSQEYILLSMLDNFFRKQLLFKQKNESVNKQIENKIYELVLQTIKSQVFRSYDIS